MGSTTLHITIGRFDTKSHDISKTLDWATSARNAGCLVKVNTVVSKYNWHEDMTQVIRDIQPIRWKVFQALRVDGQNDSHSQDFMINDSEFESFCSRHKNAIGETPMIVEDNQIMTGSYLMISPDGRFYDNTRGIHTYSKPILEVGWDKALSEITVDSNKFEMRDGRYYEHL